MGYRGIIFNSVNVGLLNGELGKKVKDLNIRTAVVSRKTRTDVKKALKRMGVAVDVIIGGNDLNTRHRMYVKPMADPMMVAAAKMFLEPEDVVVFGDYKLDKQAAEEAGMKYCSRIKDLVDVLEFNDSEVPGKIEDSERYSVPTFGIMGAICGDIIGSAYEFHPTQNHDFEAFVKGTHVTDDTYATLAVAKWIMGDRSRESLIRCFAGICNRRPNAGYGSGFKKWLRSKDKTPYGGVTNGAMMRASACGWAASSLEEALDIGKRSAEVSHDSKEGIMGAQSVAAGIYLLRNGYTKEKLSTYIQENFGYDLGKTLEEHHAQRSKDYSCHVSGPQAFKSYLSSSSYEETVRNAVLLETDADTIADIAGALAAADKDMQIPQEWADRCFEMLDDESKGIVMDFYKYIGDKR